jgi:hypothetical protein
VAEGIRKLHSAGCPARGGGRCGCRAGYEASVFSARDGKKIRKTFPTLAAAKAWRVDALAGVRRGSVRATRPTTVREAAERLLLGCRAARFERGRATSTSRASSARTRPPSGCTPCPSSVRGGSPTCSAGTFKASSTICSPADATRRRSETRSCRFGSSIAAHSRTATSPSTRAPVCAFPPAAGGETASSLPSRRRRFSRRSPRATARSGRWRSMPDSAEARSWRSAGRTSTSRAASFA